MGSGSLRDIDGSERQPELAGHRLKGGMAGLESHAIFRLPFGPRCWHPLGREVGDAPQM
jgi:hypothetical protein